MQHVYLHISAHKTHISATLTSCLLCVGYFFHLFFLPPSCFSLSLRAEAGCWETVDSVLLLCCHFSHSLFFALSLNATCPVTWFIHSDRHRAGEPLSPPSISLSHSPSSSLSFQPRVYSEAGIGNSVLCWCLSAHPRPCIAFLSESVSEPLILDRYD